MKDVKDIEMLEAKAKTVFEEMLCGNEAHSYEDAYKMADVFKDMTEAKKNCYEAEYYKSVVEAMEESKKEEELMAKMGMSAGNSEERFYRNQPRNSRGQYKEDGRPNKYYDPMVMPEMMSLDMANNRTRPMHYYDGGNMSANQGQRNYDEGYNHGYNRGYSEGQNMTRQSDLDSAMRNYENYRRNHNETTPQNNSMKAKELEKVMKELEKKVDEIKMQGQMSQEEKNVASAMIKRITDKIMA